MLVIKFSALFTRLILGENYNEIVEEYSREGIALLFLDVTSSVTFHVTQWIFNTSYNQL
jgi:hypothetical protein